ncbi:MAG: adenylate/guanylate cyclase domain-containing protein, partial [Alphaproteobacteria bacterium]|nr:adenylate/guanylate cyclase domain-containing protein [Alphaproteobacteria bacterium]
GLLVAFDSIVDATLCAILIQRGIAAGDASSGAEPMLFRIGVNIGDVILARDDIFGDSVNIAARLETLAEPGGICLSKAAHDQVRGKIKAEFIDIGAHEVKNIALPVEVFALPPSAIEAIPSTELASGGPRATRRSGRIATFAAAALVLLLAAGAAGAYFHWRNRPPPETFETRLDARLQLVLPSLGAKARERVATSYTAGPKPRAFTIAPISQQRLWSGDGPSREAVTERALEGCQIAFNEPCALVAVDDDLTTLGPDGKLPVRDMPRTHYSGSFDLAQVPAMRPALTNRTEVADYAAAKGPKAIAMHVRGVFTVNTIAQTQRGAEFQALQHCNENPLTRRFSGLDGPCFLYAVGNAVVLPQRLKSPLSQR